MWKVYEEAERKTTPIKLKPKYIERFRNKQSAKERKPSKFIFQIWSLTVTATFTHHSI